VSDHDESQTEPQNDPATRLNAAWSVIDKPLVAFIRAHLKSGDEAREVAHETYLRMVDSADSEVIREPLSFAIAVAKNLLAERLRDRLCHQKLDKQFVIKQRLQFGTEEQRSPEQINAARQELEEVIQEFDRLADDRKRVFAARLDDEPTESVATRFAMEPGAVYQLVNRVRKQLGKAIGRPRRPRR
jgi:RNA polymerase sigma factor (sigma-70 family)